MADYQPMQTGFARMRQSPLDPMNVVDESTRGAYLPYARYSDGGVHPAWPSMISGPAKAFSRALSDPYLPHRGDAPENSGHRLADIADVAAAVGMGGFFNGRAATPAKSLHSNGESANISTRNVAGYDPVTAPQRPFAKDYKQKDLGDVGSPLARDIDGRSLTAPLVAGRRTVGGGDVGLGAADIENLARQLATGGFATVGPGQLPRSAVGSWNNGSREMRVLETLSPEHRARAVAHETGHAMDGGYFSGLSRTERGGMDLPPRFVSDAKKIWHEQALGTTPSGRNVVDPTAYGYAKYEVPVELKAEAFRRYLTDPNAMKTSSPGLAKEMRAHVNADPYLRQYIQLNANPAQAAIPAFAAEAFDQQAAKRLIAEGGT